MKVFIVSDSHGLINELLEITKRHAQEATAFIHCGDSELPNGCVELQSFIYVGGNCDFARNFAKERTEDIQGIRFFITHGHLYNVKMTLINLYYRAKEVGANVVCFGHSHIALAEKMDDVLFINPGSLLLPRLRKERTYASVQIDNRQAIVQFYDLNGKKVPHLGKTFTF
ncbi:metallophosphoesterase family protein [Anoxybacteroides amylolyticum]|uniref:Phosphoesterase n=1 Tax=Anoxybacteroides amylolyticum TaxID=294699 RepID=A0A160F3I7_9BACL|nr:metallophosphoesterase [Anoxybacillus amylolyticus]ANB60868.1 phosphodiesterase, family protein [Anoxybacillus amylolyticus]